MATAENILDQAEAFARRRGYNGFSFRDLATAAGIKSASVHYHFPTKGDLGAALVRRYCDRFFTALDDPAEPTVSAESLLRQFVAAFRRHLTRDEGNCLCGLFAAERGALPDPVNREVAVFFIRCRDWLARVVARQTTGFVPDSEARRQALAIIAALEGAVLIARSLDDIAVFDDIVRSLQRQPPLGP